MDKNQSILLIVSIAAVILVAGCTAYNQTAPPTNNPPPQPPPSVEPSPTPALPYTIKTSSKQGISSYLVDANGMTLYYFIRDTQGTASSNPSSTCVGSCTDLWPVFYAGTVNVPPELNTGDFSSFTRSDGLMQTAYKGWPLYYYYLDTAQGDTKGHDVNGIWFIINPTS